jgi:hypothetical protein
MEKEGLVRAFTLLGEAGLAIDVIISDRHPQIQKWLRENCKETKHYYDVWHVSKGMFMFISHLCSTTLENNCGNEKP